jgi:RimJ/RimL family protein N-acetyltransferase
VPTPEQAPRIDAPLPEVRTERLDLRRFDDADLDELAEVFAQTEVWQFPFGRGFTRLESEEFLHRQMDHWSEVGFGCWVARTIDDGRIIGYLGLSVPTFLPEILPAVEVGWRLAPSVWGRGYAQEGASAALEQAFTTLGIDSVCSVPQAGNPASARVAERLGMTFLREVAITANERRGKVTGLLYGIDRDDWLRSRPAASRAVRSPLGGAARTAPPRDPRAGPGS